MNAPAEGPAFLVEPLDELEAREVFAGHADLFDPLAGVYGGFFPNALRIMARDAELSTALVDLGELVLHRPGRVPVELKWLVAGMASRSAGCRYCQAHTLAHGANHGVPVAKIENVWDFEASDEFDESERVALRLAIAAGVTPNAVTAENFEELHRHFDDDQILEIVAVISFFGFLNRWNDTLAPPLEDVPMQFGTEHLSPSGWTAGQHG
ncbi:MAG: carboxymuconolactone decarboxylase family protein [Actinobacteria bacterium]|nr:carboxymuconolactone decarboxylase family protein [Actinomycetota bacterium]